MEHNIVLAISFYFHINIFGARWALIQSSIQLILKTLIVPSVLLVVRYWLVLQFDNIRYWDLATLGFDWRAGSTVEYLLPKFFQNSRWYKVPPIKHSCQRRKQTKPDLIKPPELFYIVDFFYGHAILKYTTAYWACL